MGKMIEMHLAGKTRQVYLTNPPRALRCRGVQLDNLALVPASLLPFKAKWQAIANSLPEGDVLIILPASGTPSRKTLEKATSLLQSKGHRVTALPAEGFI